MALKPPADPCMCGSFDTWHGECYVGLSQAEIDERHKALMTEWRRKERARLKGAAVELMRKLSTI